jgi:hypothetical protein
VLRLNLTLYLAGGKELMQVFWQLCLFTRNSSLAIPFSPPSPEPERTP